MKRMVIIQQCGGGQFTVTLPKAIIKFMKWGRGIELYPYPTGQDGILLKPLKKGKSDV